MLAGEHEHCHIDRSPTEHAIGVFVCSLRQIARVRKLTFEAESLRKPDEPLIMLERKVNVEFESDK